MKALTTPAEHIEISPEALEIANAYLTTQNIDQVSNDLNIDKHIVASTLARREVKAYVDNVFMNVGFNNRFRMRKAMDAIIKKKFQELEDSEMGSTKDIADLLALSHSMTMAELKMTIELEKVRQTNIKNQLNVQINDAGGGSNYGNLMKTLFEAGNVRKSDEIIE